MTQQASSQSIVLTPDRKRFLIGSLSLTVFMVILSITSLGQTTLQLVAPYGDRVSWYMIRSSGIVAYILFGLSSISGLLMSSMLIKKIIPTPLLYQLHQASSWIGLGLAGLHALLLLFDNYFTFTVANVVVPFTAPYQPIWVGLGIIAWYMMALVTTSFSFRKQIGQKNWRRLHYLTFIGFILMTLHGIVAGSDSSTVVMMSLYAGMGGTVLFLTLFRILAVLDK